jgi:hypothetical protein
VKGLGCGNIMKKDAVNDISIWRRFGGIVKRVPGSGKVRGKCDSDWIRKRKWGIVLYIGMVRKK